VNLAPLIQVQGWPKTSPAKQGLVLLTGLTIYCRYYIKSSITERLSIDFTMEQSEPTKNGQTPYPMGTPYQERNEEKDKKALERAKTQIDNERKIEQFALHKRSVVKITFQDASVSSANYGKLNICKKFEQKADEGVPPRPSVAVEQYLACEILLRTGGSVSIFHFQIQKKYPRTFSSC
jgi:hypothetical protein